MPDALTVGKSAIKIFTGEYNLLNDYIQDFDLACTLCNVPFDSKLRALSMFQHCSDDVKRVLRQMPPRDLYEPAKIEALLRKHYGLKDVIKASKDITTLVTMKQPKGPFLHKHFMQFMALVMAIQRDDPTMDLKTMNNGKLLKAFFINTLHDHDLIRQLTRDDDGGSDWFQFEQKVLNMAQAELGKQHMQSTPPAYHNNYNNLRRGGLHQRGPVVDELAGR